MAHLRCLRFARASASSHFGLHYLLVKKGVLMGFLPNKDLPPAFSHFSLLCLLVIGSIPTLPTSITSRADNVGQSERTQVGRCKWEAPVWPSDWLRWKNLEESPPILAYILCLGGKFRLECEK